MGWNAVILAMAAAGFAIACYFSLVLYRVLPADARFVPVFCRMREETCLTVLHHPDARLLGVPNSVLGAIYYLLIGICTIGPPQLRHLSIYVSWLTVAVGVYLVYSLLVKIKVACPLCLVTHGLNLMIALLLSLPEGNR